jgi:putative hydrolase of the HAD superfamily
VPAYKLITFDLDDTLWDIEAVVAEAERRLHAWFAVHHPAVAARYSAADLRRLRDEAPLRHPELAADMTALRRSSLIRALTSVGYDGAHAELAFAEFWRHRHDVEFYPDAIPALDALRGRYRLGAITNGNADITLVGLDAHLDFALVAAEFGVAKPDPRIFHEACRRGGVAPHETLHVGDDPLLDVIGAKRAGLDAAWIERRGRRWDEVAAGAGAAPDQVHPDLAGLVGALLR